MAEQITAENAPSVTIVIPVYNGMSTLKDCLDSLERLDYPGELETIIVDDGSTDGSGEYCRERGYQVIRQENQGPGIARNTGSKEAKGEYLVFTDADCIMDSDFVTEIVKPLLGTDIVGSQGRFYSTQKNLVARFIQHEIGERVSRLEQSEYTDWIATYAACYRKDIFLENGGFCEIYSSEDCELSFRLAKKGYKMVLAPGARVQHRNYESFSKFLRFKYKRAYWTIWLYNRFPDRMVNDKLTPSSRKSMMVLMAGAAFFLFLGIWWKWAGNVGKGFAGLLFASTLPFSWGVMKKDPVVGILSPFFLISRTVCYIFGFGKGIIDYKRGVQTVKKSADK